eukprot:gene5372-7122_t
MNWVKGVQNIANFRNIRQWRRLVTCLQPHHLRPAQPRIQDQHSKLYSPCQLIHSHCANYAAQEQNSTDILLGLLDGFRQSQTLFSAVELGVFDFLDVEKASAEDVSNGLDLSLDGTERLLDACCGLGLLQKQANGIYTNTHVAEMHLLKRSPHSFVGYILHSQELLVPLWSHLATAVAQGSNVWENTFGTSAEQVFSNVYVSTHGIERFMSAMHSMGAQTSPFIVSAFDLSSYRSVLDLAGATGHLAIAFCRAYPDSMACVGDLSQVLPTTKIYIDEASLTHRISVCEIDMFHKIPCTITPSDAPVDLIMLSRVLHDWKDDDCIKILKNSFSALHQGGGVLIAEKLLNNEKHTGPVSAQLQSLNMLVQTHGRERSLNEFETLLHHAGFVDVRAHSTGKYLDVILAKKP